MQSFQTALSHNTPLTRVLPDLMAFALGLTIAYLLHWETTDLVWSLWFCSLVIGYLTILAILGSGVFLGRQLLRHQAIPAPYKKPAFAAGIGGGLFLLLFFSVHFCGFHAGHSVFLHQFFPIEGMPRDGFGQAFMNPPLLWYLAFKHLAFPYALFLLPALIAERKHLLAPLQAVRALTHPSPEAELDTKQAQPVSGKQHFLKNAMSRPYVNVIRMHLLIFFFALVHILRIDSFAVYTVVYFVYFFPWNECKHLWRTSHNKKAL